MSEIPDWMTARDPRETKLPAWAQNILDNLRREARFADARAEAAEAALRARASADGDDGPFIIDVGDESFGTVDGTTVTARLGDVDLELTVQNGPGGFGMLRVEGVGALAVIPSHEHAIHIERRK